MTIFFSDIRQFTALFESLSPEQGLKFINSYLTRIVPVIEEYGGFVDKYIGDAIMALFPQANGADMAVRSAIEIQKRVQEYNIHRAKYNYRPLEIGIGIHIFFFNVRHSICFVYGAKIHLSFHFAKLPSEHSPIYTNATPPFTKFIP
jgi:hypothetical protein